MDSSLKGTLLLAFAYLVLFSSAEYLHHFRNVKAEVTRKYVHIITGVFALGFPFLIGNHWWVLFLCGSFFLILIITINSRWLRSIHGVSRKTSGSILYPIIVYTCYLAFEYFDALVFYYIPILILAISDPIAAFVGKSWPRGKYTVFGMTKTLSGSLGFFLSSLLICSLLLIGVEALALDAALILALSLSIGCTLAEALSHHGYDNLSIPYSALLLLALSHFWFQLP